VQCIRQQMLEIRPFPVRDHQKVLRNRFFAWCEVGVCRARCCALSLAPGSCHEGFGKVDSTPASPLKLLRQSPRTRTNPLMQLITEVRNHAKGGSVFRSGFQGSPSSCSGPCHGTILEECKAPTNMQPYLQAGSTSNLFSDTVKLVYIVRARVVLQALKPARNGQICIWDVHLVPSPFSRWSAPVNTAIPPEFLVK
jgi:hypothetical protein